MKKRSVKESWGSAWRSEIKRQQILTGSVLLLIVLFMMPFFFRHIEKRKGVVLHDWLLSSVVPHDVSGFVFAIIWGMGLLIIYRAMYKPEIFLNYCWTMLFVSILRFIAISLVPLAPPVGLIPLHDPITGIFYGEVNVTKDLFFSGHTATLTIILLCLQTKADKLIAAIALISVACLLLVQHIHYSLDVLFAPPVVYLVHRAVVSLLHKKAVVEPIGLPHVMENELSA